MGKASSVSGLGVKSGQRPGSWASSSLNHALNRALNYLQICLQNLRVHLGYERCLWGGLPTDTLTTRKALFPRDRPPGSTLITRGALSLDLNSFDHSWGWLPACEGYLRAGAVCWILSSDSRR